MGYEYLAFERGTNLTTHKHNAVRLEALTRPVGQQADCGYVQNGAHTGGAIRASFLNKLCPCSACLRCQCAIPQDPLRGPSGDLEARASS